MSTSSKPEAAQAFEVADMHLKGQLYVENPKYGKLYWECLYSGNDHFYWGEIPILSLYSKLHRPQECERCEPETTKRCILSPRQIRAFDIMPQRCKTQLIEALTLQSAHYSIESIRDLLLSSNKFGEIRLAALRNIKDYWILKRIVVEGGSKLMQVITKEQNEHNPNVQLVTEEILDQYCTHCSTRYFVCEKLLKICPIHTCHVECAWKAPKKECPCGKTVVLPDEDISPFEL